MPDARSFRYRPGRRWLKGNTHIHSTASDGGETFAGLADMYAREGYDFLFRTDHWVASDVAADEAECPLLWLDGIELDGHDEAGSMFHVVCLGKVDGMAEEQGLTAALQSAREQGAILVLAHPHWSGNSTDDALRHGFDGVEVYNHVCHWLNGKSDGVVHWDVMLERDPLALGFAADDTHARREHAGWNGGWIMVNAAECSSAAITEAIRCGDFYSTCGPEFHGIEYDGRHVRIETSSVRFARVVGPGPIGDRRGDFTGGKLTEAHFDIPEDWAYARLEIEDTAGRRAWTNSLFVQ